MRGVAIAVVLGLSACNDSGNWEVDDPPRFAYTDESTPRAELPPDASTWDTLPMPLAVGGEDSGEEGIVYSAALAGYYIMRIQRDSDGYHYQWDPEAGVWEESDNLHRKCGATFTQVWLYRFTGREDFRLSTQAALRYLTGRAEPQADGTIRLRDLGATSLISLSLTEYARLAQTDEWDDQINGVGEHLLTRVGPDGSFTEGSPLQWAQAHQALWRLYSYTQDVRYLDALQSVARFFYDNRDDNEIIDFPYLYGLWANEPLTELYMVRPADWIAEFVFEVGDDVASKQYTPGNTDRAEWIGGYFPNSGSGQPNWNSTLKLEAVIDAYRMAKVANDPEHLARFRKSALIGAAWLQSLQLRIGETDEFDDPALPIGGTPFTLTDPKVRIDVPHHMANAILKVVAYMDLEDYPGIG